MSLFGEYLDSPNESFFFQEPVRKSKSKNKQEAVLKKMQYVWIQVSLTSCNKIIP